MLKCVNFRLGEFIEISVGDLASYAKLNDLLTFDRKQRFLHNTVVIKALSRSRLISEFMG
jgi:hypothetical protein